MKYNLCFAISDEQLRQGAFVLYVMFGIYAFTLLAIVCNDYFIPCVELICEDLKIPQVGTRDPNFELFNKYLSFVKLRWEINLAEHHV